MKTLVFLAALLILLPTSSCLADAPSGTEQDHQELRQLLQVVKDAIETRNAAALKPYLHETFAITVLNQQVVTGEHGVEDLFRDWFLGANAPLKSLKIEPVATIPTHIYDGRFGTVYGTSTDTFELADGDSYAFQTHWTAAVIKEEGRWKLLTAHIGSNPLDNAFLHAYRKAMGFGGVLIEMARLFRGS